MASNTPVKLVLQTSEQAAPAVHMPIIVGNELFIATQQDIRRVEDVRLLTCQRVSAAGQLCPLTTHCASTAAPTLAGHAMSSSPFYMLQQLVAHCQNKAEQQKLPQQKVCSVARQLSSSKQCQSHKPFPLYYSAATSTTALEPLSTRSANHKCSQTCTASPTALHVQSQTSDTSVRCKADQPSKERSSCRTPRVKTVICTKNPYYEYDEEQQKSHTRRRPLTHSNCNQTAHGQSCDCAVQDQPGRASRRRPQSSVKTGFSCSTNSYYEYDDERPVKHITTSPTAINAESQTSHTSVWSKADQPADERSSCRTPRVKTGFICTKNPCDEEQQKSHISTKHTPRPLKQSKRSQKTHGQSCDVVGQDQPGIAGTRRPECKIKTGFICSNNPYYEDDGEQQKSHNSTQHTPRSVKHSKCSHTHTACPTALDVESQTLNTSAGSKAARSQSYNCSDQDQPVIASTHRTQCRAKTGFIAMLNPDYKCDVEQQGSPARSTSKI